jgi:hypothetical protein
LASSAKNLQKLKSGSSFKNETGSNFNKIGGAGTINSSKTYQTGGTSYVNYLSSIQGQSSNRGGSRDAAKPLKKTLNDNPKDLSINTDTPPASHPRGNNAKNLRNNLLSTSQERQKFMSPGVKTSTENLTKKKPSSSNKLNYYSNNSKEDDNRPDFKNFASTTADPLMKTANALKTNSPSSSNPNIKSQPPIRANSPSSNPHQNWKQGLQNSYSKMISEISNSGVSGNPNNPYASTQ